MQNELQRRTVLKRIQAFPLGDSGFDVRFQEHQFTRTAEQNNLLWPGAYRPIARYLSEKNNRIITDWHVHEICKQRIAPHETNPIDGKVYPKSTTKMTKSEFSEYLEEVWSWGAEMGVWFD